MTLVEISTGNATSSTIFPIIIRFYDFGIAGNGGGIIEVGNALACGIDAFKARLTYVATFPTIGRVARRIDDGTVTNHFTLTGNALIVLAK